MSDVPAGASPGSDDEPVVVDARGLRCPLPVIRLAARARGLPAGTRMVVLTTDPAARHDVPAWARMRGHVMDGDEEVAERGRSDGTGDGAAGDARNVRAPGVRRLTVVLAGEGD